jgi:hypothetical protein
MDNINYNISMLPRQDKIELLRQIVKMIGESSILSKPGGVFIPKKVFNKEQLIILREFIQDKMNGVNMHY